MEKPKPQEIYRHFKGRLYQVLTLATNSETREEMVVYQALYGDYSVFCRPLWMFTEALDTFKYPDAGQTYRFEPVKPMSEQVRTKIDKPTVPDVLQKEVLRTKESQGARQEEPVDRGVMGKTIEEEALELNMDTRVVAFLDADSSEKRMKILGDLAHDITDDQIDICAMAIDVKIGDGETFDRYIALRDSLTTKMRFETNRLRE